MSKEPTIGYREALKLTLEMISPLTGTREVELAGCLDRIISKDLYSQVDSPSIDASMKDGYAVQSVDIRHASPGSAVRLDIVGTAAAGRPASAVVTGNTAIRILTGARVPDGADAVLAGEFAERQGDVLTVVNTAEPGRNILLRGSDVKAGELVASRGTRLTPGMIGTLVAAGYSKLPVFRRPRVAVLATGDELVIPGQPLPEGKLYASNLEMVRAWCRRCSMVAEFSILGDSPEAIAGKMEEVIATHDAVITSGGAWTGDRDFVADALDALGWKRWFHRVRMGPGKAVGFGLLRNKPVFLLPGGPPSNLTAFLQIALPGLLKLGGHGKPILPCIHVKLKHGLSSRQRDWTEFVYGYLEDGGGQTLFQPLKMIRRLKSMADAHGVITIPEGVASLPAGAMVSAQLLG